MAITYTFTRSGYRKIITVYKDGAEIYTNSSIVAPKELLINEAKLSLKDRYPGADIEAMTESSAPPKNQVAVQSTSDQNNPQTTTIQQQSNNIPPKIEEKKLEPTEGQSVAKGFSKIIVTINKSINKVRVAVNNAYYGKTNISNKKKLSNPLDYGLVNLLNVLASVDLCAVFSFAANKLPGTKSFNPVKDKEKAKTPLGKAKYQIQNSAYEIQNLIDGYYLSYGSFKSSVSKSELSKLTKDLSQYLQILLSPAGDNPFQNRELKTAFPSISIFDNYLQNASKLFELNQNILGSNAAQIDKVLSYIDKTRQVCVSIQALNNPANLIGFADTFLGANIGEQLQKLDKILDSKKITKYIKDIISACQKLQTICNQLLSFINLARTIIKIATVLIQIFKIIAKFLLILPVPNMFTTGGITTAMANAHSKVTDTADFFLKRLSEINSILENIYYLCQDITIKIGNIIDLLSLVTANIQGCNSDNDLTSDLTGDNLANQDDNVNNTNISADDNGQIRSIRGNNTGNNLIIDPNLLNELNLTINNLKATKDSLDDFIKNYENNKKKTNSTFGNYNIVILTEEVVDEAITLKRRYGVALDLNGIEVVKSKLTFASDDKIIIQEVKLLLMSKNLVSPTINLSSTPYNPPTESFPSSYNPSIGSKPPKKIKQSKISMLNPTEEQRSPFDQIAISDPTELAILEESLNFLEDPSIDINAVDDTVFDASLDDTENEDEEAEDSLNINAFISKLKGGRKMRRRMRLMMAKEKLKLVESLTKADSGGGFTSNTTKKQKQSAINDAIKAENELILSCKQDIKKYMGLMKIIPASAAVYVILIRKRNVTIKDAENKISQLRKQL